MPQPLHTTPIEQFHNPRVALNQGSVKSVATAFVYSFAAVLLVPHVRFWPYYPYAATLWLSSVKATSGGLLLEYGPRC